MSFFGFQSDASDIMSVVLSGSGGSFPFAIDNHVYGGVADEVSAVPIPAAAFLFGPALLGFMGLRRKAKNSVV